MKIDDPFSHQEITSTLFRATVSESESYQFAQYASQDVNASVRITHLAYTPPSSETWSEYWQHRKQPAPPAGTVLSVAAKVRTLQLDNTIKSFVIAAFPLNTSRIATEMAEAPSASASPSTITFAGPLEVVMPVPSDIASDLSIRLDVDGSVELEVEGPGQVAFVGEQFSALVPEWMNHRMFHVGPGDEEAPEEEIDMDEEEWEEMFRLAR